MRYMSSQSDPSVIRAARDPAWGRRPWYKWPGHWDRIWSLRHSGVKNQLLTRNKVYVKLNAVTDMSACAPEILFIFESNAEFSNLCLEQVDRQKSYLECLLGQDHLNKSRRADFWTYCAGVTVENGEKRPRRERASGDCQRGLGFEVKF